MGRRRLTVGPCCFILSWWFWILELECFPKPNKRFTFVSTEQALFFFESQLCKECERGGRLS